MLSLDAYSQGQVQDALQMLLAAEADGVTDVATVIAALRNKLHEDQAARENLMEDRSRRTSAAAGKHSCPVCGGAFRRLPVNTSPATRTGDNSVAVLLCMRCRHEEWI